MDAEKQHNSNGNSGPKKHVFSFADAREVLSQLGSLALGPGPKHDALAVSLALLKRQLDSLESIQHVQTSLARELGLDCAMPEGCVNAPGAQSASNDVGELDLDPHAAAMALPDVFSVTDSFADREHLQALAWQAKCPQEAVRKELRAFQKAVADRLSQAAKRVKVQSQAAVLLSSAESNSTGLADVSNARGHHSIPPRTSRSAPHIALNSVVRNGSGDHPFVPLSQLAHQDQQPVQQHQQQRLHQPGTDLPAMDEGLFCLDEAEEAGRRAQLDKLRTLLVPKTGGISGLPASVVGVFTQQMSSCSDWRVRRALLEAMQRTSLEVAWRLVQNSRVLDALHSWLQDAMSDQQTTMLRLLLDTMKCLPMRRDLLKGSRLEAALETLAAAAGGAAGGQRNGGGAAAAALAALDDGTAGTDGASLRDRFGPLAAAALVEWRKDPDAATILRRNGAMPSADAPPGGPAAQPAPGSRLLLGTAAAAAAAAASLDPLRKRLDPGSRPKGDARGAPRPRVAQEAGGPVGARSTPPVMASSAAAAGSAGGSAGMDVKGLGGGGGGGSNGALRRAPLALAAPASAASKAAAVDMTAKLGERGPVDPDVVAGFRSRFGDGSVRRSQLARPARAAAPPAAAGGSTPMAAGPVAAAGVGGGIARPGAGLGLPPASAPLVTLVAPAMLPGSQVAGSQVAVPPKAASTAAAAGAAKATPAAATTAGKAGAARAGKGLVEEEREVEVVEEEMGQEKQQRRQLQRPDGEEGEQASAELDAAAVARLRVERSVRRQAAALLAMQSEARRLPEVLEAEERYKERATLYPMKRARRLALEAERRRSDGSRAALQALREAVPWEGPPPLLELPEDHTPAGTGEESQERRERQLDRRQVPKVSYASHSQVPDCPDEPAELLRQAAQPPASPARPFPWYPSLDVEDGAMDWWRQNLTLWQAGARLADHVLPPELLHKFLELPEDLLPPQYALPPPPSTTPPSAPPPPAQQQQSQPQPQQQQYHAPQAPSSQLSAAARLPPSHLPQPAPLQPPPVVNSVPDLQTSCTADGSTSSLTTADGTTAVQAQVLVPTGAADTWPLGAPPSAPAPAAAPAGTTMAMTATMTTMSHMQFSTASVLPAQPQPQAPTLLSQPPLVVVAVLPQAPPAATLPFVQMPPPPVLHIQQTQQQQVLPPPPPQLTPPHEQYHLHQQQQEQLPYYQQQQQHQPPPPPIQDFTCRNGSDRSVPAGPAYHDGGMPYGSSSGAGYDSQPHLNQPPQEHYHHARGSGNYYRQEQDVYEQPYERYEQYEQYDNAAGRQRQGGLDGQHYGPGGQVDGGTGGYSGQAAYGPPMQRNSHQPPWEYTGRR